MSIKQITDHAEKAKDRLPDHLSGAVNLNALIDVLAQRHQNLETLLFDVLEKRAISTGIGIQLDGMGTILDINREVGEDDTTYRSRLFSRASELAKSGEPEVLIEAFNFLLNPSSVFFQEFYPAGALLTAHDDSDPQDPSIDADVHASMVLVKAGGVELILQMAPTTTFFEFSQASEVDANGNGPIDANHGFGDETLTEGGGLARVF